MKPVLVLDFDDTLTALPAVWRGTIRAARQMDIRVICVTQRTGNESNIDEVDEWLADHDISIPVYFTGGASKIDYLREQLQIEKFILCDDNPVKAVNGW